MPKKVIILGGGISGASMFYHIAKYLPNWEIALLDKNDKVGGINRDFEINGLRFSLGSRYIFNLNDYTDRIVKRFAARGCRAGQSIRSVYFRNNKFLKFPVQMNTAGLPLSDRIGYLLSLLFRSKKKTVISFEDWAIRSFGRKIAQDFILNHNYKCWKVDPSEIDYMGVAKKVMFPSVLEMLWGGIIAKGHPNDEFLYPIGGIGLIVEEMIRLSKELCKRSVRTGMFVHSVSLKDKAIMYKDKQGNTFHDDFDILVNTIPLPGFINLIDNAGDLEEDSPVRLWAEMLRFNVMASVMLIFKGEITDRLDHFIYVPDKRYSFSRISIPKNFDETACPEGYSSLLAEVNFPQDRKKLLLMPEYQRNVISQVLFELNEIFPKASETEAGSKLGIIDPAYIITDRCYGEAVCYLHNWLQEQNVLSLGRFANWTWSRIEDIIPESRGLTDGLGIKYGE